MDYEKLGLFYLGRVVDPGTRAVTAAPLLYDASDLVTHAAIIGMTGSGKTGLGIGVIEEAALDGIPVLAIDPKGDLGNLLLTFPNLDAADFAPWTEERLRAEDEAARWKKGLTEWDQSGERIAKLRAAADFAIYTPGSTAGTPISIVKSFAPPAAATADDADAFAERISTTATSVLSLAGVDAEPMRSREHILLSTLLQEAWRRGSSFDLPQLIAAVQSPTITKIGVMDLDTFYPANERFELAMRLNHLLAAPTFAAWMQGDPLDVSALLYTSTGKPRVSIMSIAHLSENERMFFVSLLLNELVGWVRAQRGTSSLRALVYFDEVFGFLPPVANPPSKQPLLTLLKQARAHGVGMVLATQNPVDLDYKALSNTGTWFLGRLQTERDKARVLDGLEGAATTSGGHFDRAEMDRALSGLEKRVFLLHNVHEQEPVLFQTRWTMSYLRGPLGRAEISRLASRPASATPPASLASPALPAPPAPPASSASPAPVLDPAIPQYYAPGDGAVWTPALLGAVRVSYSDAKAGIDEVRDVVITTPIHDGPVPADWEHAEPAPFTLRDLQATPPRALPYAPLPTAATQRARFVQWEKDLTRWAAQSQSIELMRSARARLVSHVDESERDFRIRVQEAVREMRDAAVAKTRQKYAAKLATAEDRLRRAEHALQREQEQASESKVSAGVSIAATIAGALLGRKAVSASTLGRATTAARGMGRIGRQAQDVERAQASLAALRESRDALAAQIEHELAAVAASYDTSEETFGRVLVKPKRGATSVQLVALVWVPQ